MAFNFSEALAAEVKNVEWRKCTVTFGGQDIAVKAKPMTPADLAQMERKYPGSNAAPTLEALCFTMIQKVHFDDNAGAKAFKQSDFEYLVKLPADRLLQPLLAGLFDNSFEIAADLPTEEQVDTLAKN
jgi:hypothetical protein